ncbi:hypothetical protein M514_08148, partial [Trichuris suis]
MSWNCPVPVFSVYVAVIMLSELGYTDELKDTCLSDSRVVPDSFDFSGTPEDEVTNPKFFRHISRRACVTSAHFDRRDNEHAHVIEALHEECNARVRDAFLLDWPFNMDIYKLGFDKPGALRSTDRFVNARYFTGCSVTSENGGRRLSCDMHIGSPKHPTYERLRCSYVMETDKWRSDRKHKKCVTGEHIAHLLVNYVSTSGICLTQVFGDPNAGKVEFLNCTGLPKDLYFGLCVYPPFKCNRIRKFLTKQRAYYGCDTCGDGRIGDFCHRYRNEPCKDIPCRHLGTCNSTGSRYECSCVKGRHGNHCQYVQNVCRNNRCQNGGTCVPTAENSISCRCRPGFRGVLCEIDIDECASNPCLNSGLCINEPGQFRCSCRNGFSGNRCENNIDDCAAKPCSPEGTSKCVDLTGTFRCVCNFGYTGFLCDQVVDACKSSPCENGGTCLKKGNGFKCLCAEGYSGRLCNGERLLCQPDSCNLGTCVQGERMFTCKCPPGFEGPTCGINRDDCREVVCQHGGACIDEINGFRCKCTRFWKGTLCNIRQDPCQIENNCVNNSTCQNVGDGYKCNCPVGLAGIFCDESNTEYKQQDKEEEYSGMLVILLAIVFLLLLLLLATACTYHHNAKSMGISLDG